jgi:hypothetical protein
MCLDALAAAKTADCEIILASDVANVANDEHPAVDTVVLRAGGLVPHLWATALPHARGDVVALTSAALAPDVGWIAHLGALARDRASGSAPAAVGGAIEPGRFLGAVGWAAYFCRYANYMLPFPKSAEREVPGDNAAYDRRTLEGYVDLYRDGFWEPFVHRAMKADGHVLEVRPELVVRQVATISLVGFSRQRFLHGREHGRRRSEGRTSRSVLVGILGTPAVPVVMTGRVVSTVLAKRRHRLALVLSLPTLIWFHMCWASGELTGRLDHVRGHR